MFQIQHLNPAKWQEGNGEGVRGKQQTASSRADYYLPRYSPFRPAVYYLLFAVYCDTNAKSSYETGKTS